MKIMNTEFKNLLIVFTNSKRSFMKDESINDTKIKIVLTPKFFDLLLNMPMYIGLLQNTPNFIDLLLSMPDFINLLLNMQ